MVNKYAEVVWIAEDVMILTKNMSKKEAEEWLASNESHIRNRLIELGWEVIDALLNYDGIELSDGS